MDSPEQRIKLCRICGDRAFGFHYNGLCCESCKVFFFRCATKQNKLKCVRNSGKCEIDPLTRKICSKCRLGKCFEEGMRIKRRKANKQIIIPQQNEDNLQLRNVLLSESSDFANPLDHILSSFPQISTYNSKNKKLSYNLFASERETIFNIQNLSNHNFVDENALQVVGPVGDWYDSLNFYSLYIRPVISFCKSNPFFKRLSEVDQLTILKPFFFEIVICRFAYMYDTAKNGHPVIQNEAGDCAVFLNFENTKNSKNLDVHEKCVKFHFDLHEQLEDDFTIRDLFIATLLFQPRDNISAQECVRYQHSLYCRMLRRYLQHKYKNVQLAERRYSKLMKIFVDFRELRERSIELMRKEVNFGGISQIIVELFNLDSIE